MPKFFGLFALSILTLSVVVHLSTFLPTPMFFMASAWPLHIGAMLAFFPMIFWLQRLKKQTNLAPDVTRNFNRLLGTYLSPPLRMLFFVVGMYTIINFCIFGYNLSEGTPTPVGDHYEIKSHGRFVRTITKDEYDHLQACLLRGFSGHWIFFSFAPTVFFLVCVPKLPVKET